MLNMSCKIKQNLSYRIESKSMGPNKFKQDLAKNVVIKLINFVT